MKFSILVIRVSFYGFWLILGIYNIYFDIMRTLFIFWRDYGIYFLNMWNYDFRIYGIYLIFWETNNYILEISIEFGEKLFKWILLGFE